MTRGSQILQSLSLVWRLSEGEPMDVTALSRLLDRGERTVRRVLRDIREAGVPLQEEVVDRRTGRKVYSIPKSWSGTPLLLGPEDTLALRFLLAQARPAPGAPFHDEVCALEEKLRAGMAFGWDKLYDQIATVLQPSPRARPRTPHASDAAEKLTDAARLHHACAVRYQRADGEERSYVLEPLLLHTRADRLYCTARVREKDRIQTFVVGRFVSVERRRTDPFTPPADFDPEAYLAASFGVFRDTPTRVRVRFAAAVARYVSEREWHPSQRLTRADDGSVELSFEAEGRPEILAWLLSFGPTAELLEPADLREELVARLRGALALYDGAPPTVPPPERYSAGYPTD